MKRGPILNLSQLILYPVPGQFGQPINHGSLEFGWRDSSEVSSRLIWSSVLGIFCYLLVSLQWIARVLCLLQPIIRLPRFGEGTSISGINNAAKSKSRGRALIWAIIFISLAAFTVQGIVTVRFSYCTHSSGNHIFCLYLSLLLK